MLKGINYIKRSQRKDYINNKEQIYHVSFSNHHHDSVAFAPDHKYIVTLPKEMDACNLYFNRSTVYFAGRKKGSLKPLTDVSVMCKECIVDLKEGMHGIPTKIFADTLIIKDANYTNKPNEPYIINKRNDFEKTIVNSLFKNRQEIYIKDSFLNMGVDRFAIKCKNLTLNDTKIILPYNNANIECENFNMLNSIINAQRESVILTADNVDLVNSYINAKQDLVYDIKGNDKVKQIFK